MSGLVNHSSGYVAGGTVPFRMGNAHPSLFPYEPLPTADGELIVIAGNDGQFRKLCQVLDLPELPDDPRFGRNQDRTANREELRPLLVERLAKRTKDEWFRELLAAGVPCAPINTIDGGVALAEELGPGPGGHGRRHPRRPQPDHVLVHPGELRAAATRARRTRRGDPRMADRELSFPTSIGTSDEKQIRLLGQRSGRRTDGQGRLRRAGVLAGGRAAARRPARPGSSRRCWSRWPTTASPRPRSRPG